MGASVIAHCDTPPIFDPCEAVFDLVPLFVERFIIRLRVFAVLLRRDTRLNPFFDQRLAEGVAVVAFIAGERLSGRQKGQHEPRAFMIAHLARRQEQNQGLAVLIGDGVQFRVQAAFRPPDTAGKSPFLKRLAAVRCALR